MSTNFGPEYQKINGVYKRTQQGVIIPGDYSLVEYRYLLDNEWSWTEKVDGTNIRLHWDGVKVTIGGRTDNANVPASLVAALSDKMEPILWEAAGLHPGTTIYGEGYGAKIQKGGGNYRPDQGFIVFDIRVGDWWLRNNDVDDITSALGLDMILSYGNFTLRKAIDMVATGTIESQWPKVQIEGLVGRPVVDLFSRNGERIITKIKVKDFIDYEKRGGAK